MHRVCVFTGSSSGGRAEYAEGAAALARALAGRGIGLVYGGASVGLMGRLADAMLAQQGSVIGVIPRHLNAKEITHGGLTELRLVGSMHERKATMADLSDGFIALPGGLGTFEELFEIWTWAQLGLHEKPCGLLNVGGYYDRLIAFLDHATTEGFIRSAQREILQVAKEPEALLDAMASYRPPGVRQWIREETA